MPTPRVEERSYLFVGGPLDRQIMDVQKPQDRYYHPVKVDAEHMMMEEYRREPFYYNGRVVLVIYHHSSVRMEEVLIRMAGAYAELRR